MKDPISIRVRYQWANGEARDSVMPTPDDDYPVLGPASVTLGGPGLPSIWDDMQAGMMTGLMPSSAYERLVRMIDDRIDRRYGDENRPVLAPEDVRRLLEARGRGLFPDREKMEREVARMLPRGRRLIIPGGWDDES